MPLNTENGWIAIEITLKGSNYQALVLSDLCFEDLWELVPINFQLQNGNHDYIFKSFHSKINVGSD